MIRDQPFAAVYDWFAANGVNEWLPESPVIEVSGDSITYTAFVWERGARRGWNFDDVRLDADGSAVLERRTVPLRVAPSPQVSLAVVVCGGALVAAGG